MEELKENKLEVVGEDGLVNCFDEWESLRMDHITLNEH